VNKIFEATYSYSTGFYPEDRGNRFLGNVVTTCKTTSVLTQKAAIPNTLNQSAFFPQRERPSVTSS
jgi:hypothetical protein